MYDTDTHVYYRFRISISMHACLSKDVYDHSAAHRALWQDLELIFRRLFQHGNRPARRARIVYASLSLQKRSCVRVWDPQKLHVSVYENVRTIVSWLLLAFKGLYDTHTQPVSVSYIHAKRCVHYVHIRKHWLAYFSYTETVIRNYACVSNTMMTSVLLRWTPSLNNCSKLKRECTDVTSGCRISVGPRLNPHSLSNNKILVLLSL